MRSSAIRDAIYDRITALGVGATRSKIGVLPLQLDQLPHVRVFVMSEAMTPDGDGNAGAPAFIVDATIAVGVTRDGDDQDTINGALDSDADAIMDALFTDPEFMRLHPEGMFESCERINRKIVPQRDGETVLAELQIEMTFRFRSEFEPVVPDHFRTARIALRDQKQPDGNDVGVEIDLPTF